MQAVGLAVAAVCLFLSAWFLVDRASARIARALREAMRP